MRAPELDLVPGVTDDPHVVDLVAFGALLVDLRRRLNAGLGSHPGDERPLLRRPIPVRGAGFPPLLILGAFLHTHRETVSLHGAGSHVVTDSAYTGHGNSERITISESKTGMLG